VSRGKGEGQWHVLIRGLILHKPCNLISYNDDLSGPHKVPPLLLHGAQWAGILVVLGQIYGTGLV
jgi:hypothetical protein